MDNILRLKLLIIALFGSVTLWLFWGEIFRQSTQTLYHFDIANIVVASIAFGVILSASIYNLAFYFYIRNRQYLYYGLAQLSILFFLINLDAIFIEPFDELFGFKSLLLLETTQPMILIFSMLFIYEFLKNYNLKVLNPIIRWVIALSIVDIAIALIWGSTILTKVIPLFIPIWLILSEANRRLDERDLPLLFLKIGWYIPIAIATIKFLGFVQYTGIVFPFLHISFSIESIFLSLAISYKFKQIDQKQKMQQSLLLQQSRLASMGEMLSIIAHQWRQPLNFLSVVNINLKKIYPDHPKGSKLLEESNKQILYMSNTIDSFREFYNPSKHKENFGLQDATIDAIKISSPALKVANIKLIENFHSNPIVYGNKNEFEQVILNLINNAKDAMLEHKVPSPTIKIEIKDREITIKDNGKGISPDNITKIFDPYFSTKKDSDGIGLYIAKMIVEQEMGGELSVESSEEGTLFGLGF